jgi:hypothetical protein
MSLAKEAFELFHSGDPLRPGYLPEGPTAPKAPTAPESLAVAKTVELVFVELPIAGTFDQTSVIEG